MTSCSVPDPAHTAQVLPGGRVLASADESGMVAACDMRMLGGDPSAPGSPGSQRLLWKLRPEGGGITCLEAGLHPGSGVPAQLPDGHPPCCGDMRAPACCDITCLKAGLHPGSGAEHGPLTWCNVHAPAQHLKGCGRWTSDGHRSLISQAGQALVCHCSDTEPADALSVQAAACVTPPRAGMPMLVAGTKSGTVHVIAADSGRAVQSLVVGQGRTGQSSGRSFFSSSRSSSASLVTGLSLTPDGLTISSFTGSACALRFAGWAC